MISKRYFYLVGCPRSGTTLLQALVNRHRRVLVPPETKLFSHYHRLPRWMRQATIRRINEDLQIDLDGELAKCDIPTDAAWEVIAKQFQLRTDRNDVSHIGDKTPEHTSRIWTIREVFPEVPIIAIVRNGYAVSESLTRVPWIHCDHRGAARIWRYYMQSITQAVDCQLDHFHVVRYEELIENPEQVLKQVFEWIGVDPAESSSCVEPNPEFDRWLFPAREKEWKGRAIESIVRSSDWNRLSLTALQIHQIRFACGAMLHRWGYDNEVANEESLPMRCVQQLENCLSVAKTVCRLPPSVVFSEGLHQWQQWRNQGVWAR